MNLGDLRTYFRGVLNRDDIDDTLCNNLLRSAIDRIARTLRVPSMEEVLELTVGADLTLAIPPRHLELKELYTPERTLIVKTWAEFRSLPSVSGAADNEPAYYCRVGGKWLLKPTPMPGTKIGCYHYVDFQPLDVDTDENNLSATAPDLIVVTACVDACTYFVDDRITAFETLHVNRLDEIRTQASLSELAGGIPSVQVSTTQLL